MCVHKFKILNVGYDPHNPLSSKYVEVNCGTCWQCQLERSNNFSFRVLHDVLQPEVLPFFVTLTYSPLYVPKLRICFTDKEGNLDSYLLSCWNKTHVQRLNKRIRRKIHYYFGIPSDAFKYLCTCERGTDRMYIDWKGMLRQAQELPHYHLMYILNNINNPVPIRKLPAAYYDYLRYHCYTDNFVSFFKFLLSSLWFYGNVDDLSFCRDIVSVTNYITKYITKNPLERLNRVRLSSIVDFYDYDFDSRLNKYINKNQAKYHDDRSLDDLLGSPPIQKYTGPKAVSWCSLLPRSFSSINLGMSFLKDKSSEDIYQYLTGQKKVCLPFKRSASLINLPQYYYNRLCRKVKGLHYDRFYARQINDHGVLCYGCQFTNPDSGKCVQTWDNVHGFTFDFRPSSYSVSSLTPLGVQVKRYRLWYNVRSCLTIAKDIFRQPDFYHSLIDDYDSFTPETRSGVIGVTHKMLDEILTIPRNDMFKRFVTMRYSDPEFYSEDERILNNLLNLVKLSRFVQSHKRHVAFVSGYKRRIGSVARKNPELFLNHFI